MRSIVPLMERNRKIPRSPRPTSVKPAGRELAPDRAFVLHLDLQARPPRRVAGRVEHVTSGRVAHVRSLRELLAFLAEALRNQAPGQGARSRDRRSIMQPAWSNWPE